MADRDQWNNQTGKKLTSNIAIAKMLFSLMYLNLENYSDASAGKIDAFSNKARECAFRVSN